MLTWLSKLIVCIVSGYKICCKLPPLGLVSTAVILVPRISTSLRLVEFDISNTLAPPVAVPNTEHPLNDTLFKNVFLEISALTSFVPFSHLNSINLFAAPISTDVGFNPLQSPRDFKLDAQ